MSEKLKISQTTREGECIISQRLRTCQGTINRQKRNEYKEHKRLAKLRSRSKHKHKLKEQLDAEIFCRHVSNPKKSHLSNNHEKKSHPYNHVAVMYRLRFVEQYGDLSTLPTLQDRVLARTQ